MMPNHMQTIPGFDSDYPTDGATGAIRFDYESALRSWRWAALRVNKVEDIIRSAVTETGPIGEAAAYHLDSGGKKFRPLFLLALAHAVGAPETAAFKTAAACEVLHNASLIHDDLQDNDQTRRGRPAVWRRFGKNTAINLGDYLIAGTFGLLAELDCPHPVRVKLIELFSDTVRKVIVGQSEELSRSRNLSMSATDYERIARRKSGKLLALPVSCALTFSDASAEQRAFAASAMQWLGVAYQIQDDLVDLFGLKENRPAGVDIRERRVTLPVIAFYDSLFDTSARDDFKRFFGSPHACAEEMDYWLEAIRHSDAVAACIDHLALALDKVSDRLRRLPLHPRSVIKAGQTRMFKYINTVLQAQSRSRAVLEKR